MRKGRIPVLLLAGLVCTFLCACDLPFLSSKEGTSSLEEMRESLHNMKPKKTVESLKLDAFSGETREIPLTGYAYDLLDEGQQAWYLEVYYILMAREEAVELTDGWIKKGYDEKDVDKAFQAVMLDHPELFYVKGYEYNLGSVKDELRSIAFSGTYTCTAEEIETRKAEIAEREKVFLGGIEDTDTTYDKLMAIYRNIILNTTYDLSAPDNQNIYSCLVGGRSVCNGYAKSFEYLCLKLGIPCSLVTGTVDGGVAHAWNLVQADGEYYLVDVTWGDASYNGEASGNPEVQYEYFMVTSEDLLKTHQEDNVVAVPRCVATRLNYYTMENCLFTSFDKAKLEQVFARAQSTEQEYVTIKAGDAEVYDALYDYLIGQTQIFSMWPRESLRYNDNEELRTLTFWVAN